MARELTLTQMMAFLFGGLALMIAVVFLAVRAARSAPLPRSFSGPAAGVCAASIVFLGHFMSSGPAYVLSVLAAGGGAFLFIANYIARKDEDMTREIVERTGLELVETFPKLRFKGEIQGVGVVLVYHPPVQGRRSTSPPFEELILSAALAPGIERRAAARAPWALELDLEALAHGLLPAPAPAGWPPQFTFFAQPPDAAAGLFFRRLEMASDRRFMGLEALEGRLFVHLSDRAWGRQSIERFAVETRNYALSVFPVRTNARPKSAGME